VELDWMEAVDEPVLLCEEIVRISGGQDSVRYGDLVDDEKVEQTFEALMGTLKAARKRGLIAFEGELLLKGQSDDVIIKLVSEGSKENEENKENQPIEVPSDADAKQPLEEVPVEPEASTDVVAEPPADTEVPAEVNVGPPQEQDPVAPSSSTTSPGEEVAAETSTEVAVEPPATTETTAEVPVEPPTSTTDKVQEQDPASTSSAEEKEKRWAVDTSYIDYRTADPNNLEPRRGETSTVGDAGLLARSASKTEDGKWQSVDTSYIDWRTQDTNNLGARQTGSSGVNHADTISSGTAKGDDGKWTVNTSYIKDRTADTSNLEARKSASNIGSVASTATKKNSDGKWAVDTSYINYRTGDASLMRNKDEKNGPVYDDPAEKQYSYEEITSDKRPAGVDPTKKEAYLSEAEFQTVMGCSKTEFSQMAKWKQQNLKKSKKLF
jgi:hypothetical protein